MTTRHSGYIVILEDDIREDDAEDLMKLLRQIRGIISVRPVEGLSPQIAIAKARALQELEKKIWNILHEDVKI